jgi:pseudaminic acid cytidylyltransferase
LIQNKKIAIIPARGGSKRIPRKNIKFFYGRPIIEYSIIAALETGLFDEVMVSTDDHEIAEVSIKAGAKVPFLRSVENSNDLATTADVICEVLQSYKTININYKIGCCIYPTAPFLNSNFLKQGYEVFQNNNFDVVYPVTQFGYPIQRSIRILENSRGVMQWPENNSKRSQDLEPIYHDVGQYYWFNSEILIQKKTLNTENFGVIVIKELMAQDIDNEEDWKLAELKFGLLK